MYFIYVHIKQDNNIQFMYIIGNSIHFTILSTVSKVQIQNKVIN